jgi:Mg2+-importing ATPase
LLTITSLTVVAIGVVLTISPLAHTLGFRPLPWQFYAVLGGFVVSYLVLVELAKVMFYAEPIRLAGQPYRTRGRAHHIRRRAARFHHINGVAPRMRRRDEQAIT